MTHPDDRHARVYERDKIKGAIRTDFILSAEIIVIALGTVANSPTSAPSVAVLATIALLMTVGVYGFVAAHREDRRPRPVDLSRNGTSLLPRAPWGAGC